MHKHDDALITALAEGTIESGSAAAAEAEVAGCARCSAELDAQRSALAALSVLPAASLSDEERSRLRSSVAHALGLPTAAPEPRRERVRRPVPWGAIAVAGLALGAVMVAVPMAGLLNTADDGAATLEMAATTSAASEADRAGGADLDSFDEDNAGDAVPEESQLAEAPTTFDAEGTTGAAATTTTVPAAATTVAETTTTVAETTTTLPVTVDELAALLATGGTEDIVANERSAPCRAEARSALADGVRSLGPSIEVDGAPGIAYLSADGGSVVVLSPSDCSVLATLP